MKKLLTALIVMAAGCAEIPQSKIPASAESNFAKLSDEFLAGYLAWQERGAGRCPECGARLTEAGPGHGHGEDVDPRWAALRRLDVSDQSEDRQES